MKEFLKLIKRKLIRFITYLLSPLRRIGLKNKDFTIISNNCWGGFVYQRYNLPYRTPFLGLFLPAPCFIELLEDFENNMKKDLHFIAAKDSAYFFKRKRIVKEYPIALLGDKIEIHFLHYKTPNDAREAWNRRKKRINPNNILFKFAEMDWCTPELIKRFDNLKFKHKICFTANNYPNCKSTLKLPSTYGTIELQDEFNYIPPHFKKYLNDCREN